MRIDNTAVYVSKNCKEIEVLAPSKSILSKKEKMATD